MAILISSQRTILVDSCGVARIIHGDNRRTILPDIVSTIDGWKLEGIDDDEYLADNFGDVEPRQQSANGLANETRLERSRNDGRTDNEQSDKMRNLERYILQGFAFERPAMSDKFDDFDTQIGCEESYRFDDCGNEV